MAHMKNVNRSFLFLEHVQKTYSDYALMKPNVVLRFVAHNKATDGKVMTETGLYISQRLRTMINELPYVHARAQGTFFGIGTTIDIYKRSTYSNAKVGKIVDLITFMIYYCKSINPLFMDRLNIKLVLSPFKKELTGHNSRIGLNAFNVNSGFTVRDYASGISTIVVYREEEVVKVLIHELLHAFDIDCKTSSSRDGSTFARLFDKETSININETFTDLYACLLNLCYTSVLLYSRNGTNDIKDMYGTLLRYESRHIMEVGARVSSVIQGQKREATHITAYYVLKAMGWLSLDEFVAYLISHKYKIGGCHEFAEFLKKVVTNATQAIKIKELNKMKAENALKKVIKKVGLNSIRMSSIDIL